jgi:anti-sigma regulatory factor (Ser/Thr protein kinase)
MTIAKRAGHPEAGHPEGDFQHEALLYESSEEFLAGTIPFILDGLADDEPVLVAVPGGNIELLTGELGRRAADVRFVEMTQAGRNPGRIIPGVLHAFISAYPDTRPRIIGEPIWPGRTALEYPACVQHEALINLTFATWAAWILCPYDAVGLDRAVLSDAERTHPTMVNTTGKWRSDRYATPRAVVASFNRPLPAAPEPAITFTFDGDALSTVRQVVAHHAARAGLDETRIADLQVAVNEVATNSIEHAGAPGTLRIWQDPTNLVCEVRDDGRLTDPLAGRLPPAPDSESGRGLLLVNYLCDLVRVHTHRAGVTIRMHMSL